MLNLGGYPEAANSLKRYETFHALKNNGQFCPLQQQNTYQGKVKGMLEASWISWISSL
jgi:hypothetical protein